MTISHQFKSLPLKWLGVFCVVALLVCGCSAADVSPQSETSNVNDRAPLQAGEYGTKMTECLEAFGWEAEAGDGAVHAEFPDHRADEFYANFSACEHEIGARSELPWDASTQQDRFVVYVEQTACLKSNGVEGPFIESLDDFVAEGPGGIHASQHLSSLPIAVFVELEEECLS